MRLNKTRMAAGAALLSTALSLLGCNDGKDGAAGADGTNGADGADGIARLVTVSDVVRTNANIAYAVYGDALIEAKKLRLAIEALIDAPTVNTLAAAKSAWLAAREPYGESEIFRFRASPIDAMADDGSMGNDGDGPEGRINAWPLGEALIDYVANQVDGNADPELANSTDGIANNIIADTINFPVINVEVLKDNIELGGDERNVATGYHAIEFLLWGQDLNEDGTGTGARDNSAGQRPATDYDTAGACTSGIGNSNGANAICTRRGQYLLAAADLLIEDLSKIVHQWHPNVAGNYYESYIAAGDASLKGMLESMGRMSYGELAAERIRTALLEESQEDEQSCFSDNTHRDIYLNYKGVDMTFKGEYTRIDGTVISGAGIDDLLLAEGELELENTFRAVLEESEIKTLVLDVNAKSGVPFDQQISIEAYKPSVEAAVIALIANRGVVEATATALGIDLVDLTQDTEQTL